MTIAGIYARKSNDQTGVNANAKSVTRQVERARAFVHARGWVVLDDAIFVDDGIGGGRV